MKEMQRIDEKIEQLRVRVKDSEDLKVWGDVFDVPTLKALYRLASKDIISAMGGVISTGKEANVFHAIGKEGELAIKIYKIVTSDFRAMQEYLTGDSRFKNIKHNKKDIVLAWARKELRNLSKAYEAGVRVPKPMVVERNVLVMEFIGKDEHPAPLLKDVAHEIKDPAELLAKIVDYMSILYNKSKLVHADLSEYNILYDGSPIFIDMGQSVTRDHPNAETFLLRDVKNIVKFFRKLGVECSDEEVVAKIR